MDFGPRLESLVRDMFATMYDAKGVGLAANQIGIDLRVFVFDCPDYEQMYHKGILVNPELVIVGKEVIDDSEGCLSLPGVYSDLERPNQVIAKGQDLEGRPMEIEGFGYFARCLMHETNHLDGSLFIDHLKGAERRAAIKTLRMLEFEM